MKELAKAVMKQIGATINQTRGSSYVYLVTARLLLLAL